MKFKPLIFIIAAIFAVQIAGTLLFLSAGTVPAQDAVEINDILQDCTANFDRLEQVAKTYKYDFSVIDNNGELVFSTRDGLSSSINKAVKNRDTILDISVGGAVVGKLIVASNYAAAIRTKNIGLAVFSAVMTAVTAAVLIGYIVYINKRVVKPFHSLNDFATEISKGNLDSRLKMDRQNIFGAFTESFDIMRTELQKAKDAEQKANESKKQLIASLSHDIKTPVASIKAIAEVEEIKASAKDKPVFAMINKKADQVNELVSNLFSATLEEMDQLSINACDYNSGILSELIASSDYLKLVSVCEIPEMLLSFDKLRLQQVLDNIISNSYKYANTKIEVSFETRDKFLLVKIKDFGGYAENPGQLLGKFYRGQNAAGKAGTGLGLYISKYLMTAMGGDLELSTCADSFSVVLSVKIS